jgi:hypothetical protein
LLAITSVAQEKKIDRLTKEDWAYKLRRRPKRKLLITATALLATQRSFSQRFQYDGQIPGVVLGQDGRHPFLDRDGALAERGLVAMTIDYRGWGSGRLFRKLSPLLARATMNLPGTTSDLRTPKRTSF